MEVCPGRGKTCCRYLKQDINLVAELSKYEETAKRYIGKGAGDILIRNINLPKDSLSKRNNKRAMDGLKTLKNDWI